MDADELFILVHSGLLYLVENWDQNAESREKKTHIYLQQLQKPNMRITDHKLQQDNKQLLWKLVQYSGWLDFCCSAAKSRLHRTRSQGFWTFQKFISVWCAEYYLPPWTSTRDPQKRSKTEDDVAWVLVDAWVPCYETQGLCARANLQSADPQPTCQVALTGRAGFPGYPGYQQNSETGLANAIDNQLRPKKLRSWSKGGLTELYENTHSSCVAIKGETKSQAFVRATITTGQTWSPKPSKQKTFGVWIRHDILSPF